MIAETVLGDALLGAGVVVLLVLLALIVGWRRDKRTRSVRAGVFLERELYTEAELDALEPGDDDAGPEPRFRPVD